MSHTGMAPTKIDVSPKNSLSSSIITTAATIYPSEEIVTDYDSHVSVDISGSSEAHTGLPNEQRER
jgi:hypothetical protein